MNSQLAKAGLSTRGRHSVRLPLFPLALPTAAVNTPADSRPLPSSRRWVEGEAMGLSGWRRPTEWGVRASDDASTPPVRLTSTSPRSPSFARVADHAQNSLRGEDGWSGSCRWSSGCDHARQGGSGRVARKGWEDGEEVLNCGDV